MDSISEALDDFKSLSESLLNELHEFMAPYVEILPDARFQQTLRLFVPGMLAAGSPQVTKAAAHAPNGTADPWLLAKQIYTLLSSKRLSHQEWVAELGADARQRVEAEAPKRVLVALDPMNLEKAYAKKIEGISTVRKSTPPGSWPRHEARLTKGYPTIIAQTVNLQQVAVPYARLFSYKTDDFVSETRELKEAMDTIRQVLPQAPPVCLVADAGLDDQKLFRHAQRRNLEFIVRATSNRLVDVYNERLDRWEREKLLDLAETMPGQAHFETSFTHAGDTIKAEVSLDWLAIRLPDSSQELWMVVTETRKIRPHVKDNEAAKWVDELPDPLVLITNRPVHTVQQARQIYQDWRRRASIEHLYRFVQEDGLQMEDIQLHKLERFRRLFVLVLVAALFVLRMPGLWAPALVHWLRQLGSAVAATAMDRQGHYLLRYGIQRVLSCLSLLRHCAKAPPPLDLLPERVRHPT